MPEVVIGIDVGTSYMKAVMRSAAGNVVRASRKKSPLLNNATVIKAYSWWECLRTVVRDLLTDEDKQPYFVGAICISAIAPTLTVFDRVDHTRAFSILYSSLTAAGASSWSQSDRQLTDYRLKVLNQIANSEGFISPAITDLVGYLNWCLTKELTINSISLAEMGMNAGLVDCEALSIRNSVPRLVAVAEPIGTTSMQMETELGLRANIPVCGGCPDTMGSILGAGLRHASETMLYLGTFGSFMRLEDDVENLLETSTCYTLPFTWLLSVPGLGPEIEFLSSEWFHSSDNQLQQLDCSAEKSQPGANGSLFLLPRWKEGMKTVGDFLFIPGQDSEIGDTSRKARAVHESLGYAILALTGSISNSIKVSGGGARSRPWLDAISAVLGVDIEAQDMSWEATGTADIAARIIWKEDSNRSWYQTSRPANTNIDLIKSNLNRAIELYRKGGWI